MPWFKVDDKLWNHKKPRRAGAAAMGLWVLSGSWASAELSDGFVPDSVCAQWAPNYRKLAKSLIDVGLWTAGEKDGERGWYFHDWMRYQPSAAKVRSDRTEAQKRMAKLRSAS